MAALGQCQMLIFIGLHENNQLKIHTHRYVYIRILNQSLTESSETKLIWGTVYNAYKNP